MTVQQALHLSVPRVSFYVALTVLDLLRIPGKPQTQRSTFLYLPMLGSKVSTTRPGPSHTILEPSSLAPSKPAQPCPAVSMFISKCTVLNRSPWPQKVQEQWSPRTRCLEQAVTFRLLPDFSHAAAAEQVSLG